MAAIRKVQTQQEKVIDYQYIRNIKNKEVRKNRFKRSASQTVFRFLLALVLLAELGYLGFQGFRMLNASSLFFVHNVVVTGTQRTTPEEIKKIVLAEPGSALLADLTAIKLRLESHPWIESVIIWRELPETIRVHVTERKAVALVLTGSLFLVDQSGRIIQSFDHQPEYAALPVLTGVNDLSDQARIRSILESVNALSRSKEVLRQVSEIHYYDNNSTIVYLKGISFGLLVSKDGILPMIKKFIAYSDFVKKNFPNQRIIDLRYKDQIVVKNSYEQRQQQL